MRLLVFPQYAKLIAHFRAIASACAAEKARWPICRVEAQNGVAHLRDHAMNVLALTGGETAITQCQSKSPAQRSITTGFPSLISLSISASRPAPR